jgi:hypothetical protein
MQYGSCNFCFDGLYLVLDLRNGIYSVENQRLGNTILIYEKRSNNDDEASTLIGLAIYHGGPRTEAVVGTCYIKFGAVRASQNASKHFGYLLDICDYLRRHKEYLAR